MEAAKRDFSCFIQDKSILHLWNMDYFFDLEEKTDYTIGKNNYLCSLYGPVAQLDRATAF